MHRSALLLGSVAVAGLLAAVSGPAHAGATLDGVKSKGFVQCGVNVSGLPGFATVDASNTWSGIDVDLCRAVAAGLFGDATKVKYTPLNAKERFTALQSGEIDVLSRNTTWTSSRDSTLGSVFAGTLFYDGQGFMVKKASKITKASQLNGATVCVQPGTTTEPGTDSAHPNLTYVRELWHAVQTQEISGNDMLLALSQRSLAGPAPVDGARQPGRRLPRWHRARYCSALPCCLRCWRYGGSGGMSSCRWGAGQLLCRDFAGTDDAAPVT